MKKIIALSLILSTAAAFAEDAVYGAFVLNSDKAEVVLCVPWVNPGSDDGAIKVTDLLDKSTLLADDQIHYYDLIKKGYISWQLNADKEWELARGQTLDNNEEPTLVRGNAIILKRENIDSRQDKRIIINGQVGTNPANAMRMARAEGLAYTLIAPASPDKATSIDSGKWDNVKPSDTLIVGSDLMPYYYNETEKKWGTRFDLAGGKVQWSYPNPAPTIPAGQGAWFVAQGEASAKTTWDPSAK